MLVVVKSSDGCVLDCPVHALDLAIGPGMARFGQPMVDIEIGACQFEGMDADKNTLRLHLLDIARRPPVAARIGKMVPLSVSTV